MAAQGRHAAGTAHRAPQLRPLVLAVALASLGFTGAVAVVPALDFAYRNPELHIALATAESVIGLLVAFLVFGRFQRKRRLEDLLLLGGLVFLALTNLLFSAVPAIFGGNDTSVFSTWTALIGRLLGAAMLAAAALAPDRRLRLSKRELLALGIAAVVTLGGAAALVGALQDWLPRGVQTSAPELSGRPRLEGHWAILAAQLAGMLFYATAAVGFVRRYERYGDGLLRWLAIGAVLSAVARINYFLYPSLFTEWVYTGDLFRLSFYLVILVGAGYEIRSYWRAAAATAALEERRRIARDLHDGLAQELASIKRNLGWLDPEDRFVKRAGASAERALAQARRAIHTLSEGRPGPLSDALAEAARTVGEREGTRVVLDLSPAVELEPAEREALIMIASEAITNAARHADTDLVKVELSSGRRVRLRVRDFGRGFDQAGVVNGGEGRMGLRVMRERAEAVGARLRIESRRGEGTDVEVSL